MRFIIVGLFLLLRIPCFSQDDDFVGKYFELKDKVYEPQIKTVTLQPDSWDLSMPIIELGAEVKLVLDFDDLSNEIKDYTVTLIHCTPDWQESDIMKHEYIDGFHEDNIYNYSYSFNTVQKYVHYQYTVPNQNMNITKSGNYVLKVYQNFDEEDVVLSKRFMVYQDMVTIGTDLHQATFMSERYTHHELDVSFSHKDLEVSDPFSEFEIVLRQNERWDNAVRGIKPVFIRGNQLIYNYDKENIFPAGNEYRNFDIRDLNYYSQRIDSITYDNTRFDVYLFSDKSRASERHYNRPDINGKMKIGTSLSRAFTTDADYAYVHFNLQYGIPFDKGAVYIFGALTDWQLIPEAKMVYNHELFRYECTMQLKQGYYNYEYVYVEQDQEVGQSAVIEGSHFQTENLYSVYIYHKSFSSDFYRLVGFKTVSSL